MKRILITGKDSYIGLAFKKYLEKYPNDYYVEELDMLDEKWKQFDFSNFDVVFHVAGLAHSTPNKNQKELYYRVNTNLTYDVAKRAKTEGVNQFIFMSSIIVYGSGVVEGACVIKEDTPLVPDDFYGNSKKQAELKLETLESEQFKIVILRPPMVYGPDSKGNYPRLVSLAKKTPIFPNILNQRSMLFLNNLLSFIKLMIDYEEYGLFFPQNEEYVCTKDLVKEIGEIYNHRIWFTKLFNPIIKLLKNQKQMNKLFGSLTIDKKLSEYKYRYCQYSFRESIRISEGNTE